MATIVALSESRGRCGFGTYGIILVRLSPKFILAIMQLYVQPAPPMGAVKPAQECRGETFVRLTDFHFPCFGFSIRNSVL